MHNRTNSSDSYVKNQTYPETSARLRRPSTGMIGSVRPEITRSSPRGSTSSSGSSLTSGELIDMMEKEQEGIVMKLSKELNQLREENKLLRAQLDNPSYRRTSVSSVSRDSVSRSGSISSIGRDFAMREYVITKESTSSKSAEKQPSEESVVD